MNDYIERSEDKLVYQFYESALENIKEKGHPSLFAVKAPAGRGKSKLTEHLLEAIESNYKNANIINIDLKVIEEAVANNKLIDKKYIAFAMYVKIAISIYSQLSKYTQHTEAKELVEECKRCISLWNEFSKQKNIGLETNYNKNKEKVFVGLIDIGIKVAAEFATSYISIPYKIISALFTVSKDKTTELGINKIVDIFSKKTNSFNVEDEDKVKTFDEDQSDRALNIIQKMFENLFIDSFSYFSDNPFLIAIDNAETMDDENNKILYESLLFNDMPVIWYISGKLLPFEEKINKYEYINFINNEPIVLDAFNEELVLTALKNADIKIDNKEVNIEHAKRLYNQTKGNPLWTQLYIDDLQIYQRNNGSISDEYFNSLISKNKDMLIERMIGCKLLDKNLQKNQISKILYGMLPSAQLSIYDEIAIRCGANIGLDETFTKTVNSEDTYYIHEDLKQYIRNVLIKEFNNSKQTILSNKIVEIINVTKDLICEKIKNNPDDYDLIMNLIQLYENYDYLFNSQTNINKKQSFAENKISIMNEILKYTHDYKFISRSYICNNISISQQNDYFLNSFDYYYSDKKSVEIESLTTLNYNLKKELLDKHFDLDYLQIYKNILKNSIGFINNPLVLEEINDKDKTLGQCEYFKLVTNNCDFALNNICKLDYEQYLKLKDLYFKNLELIEDKANNSEIKHIIFCNKNSIVFKEKSIYQEKTNILDYLKDIEKNIDTNNLDEYFFQQNDVFYSLLQIKCNEQEKEYVFELFKDIYSKYFDLLNNDTKNVHFIYLLNNFKTFISKNGLNKDIEDYLLNNINRKTNYDKALECLLNYYDENKMYDKVENVVSFLVDKYSIDINSEQGAQSFDRYIATIFKTLLNKIIHNQNNEKDNGFNKLVNVSLDKSLIYSDLYDVVKHPDKNNLNYLLSIYFSSAKMNFKDEDELYFLHDCEKFNRAERKEILEKYNFYSSYKLDKLRSKRRIFNEQIEIENITLLLIIYIFRTFTTNEDIEKFYRIIKENCYNELNDCLKILDINNDISINNIKVYNIISSNIYRKIFNLNLISNILYFKSINVSNTESSNLTIDAICFKDTSTNDFYNSAYCKKAFISYYLYEYNCKTLVVNSTLDNYSKLCKQIDRTSLAMNISNKLFNDFLFFLDENQDQSRNHLSCLFKYVTELLLWVKDDPSFNDEFIKYFGNNALLQYTKLPNININIPLIYVKFLAVIGNESNVKEDVIKILIEINNNSSNKVIHNYVYRKIGMIYYELQNFESSVSNFMKAQECAYEVLIKEEISDRKKFVCAINSTYDFLVNIYLKYAKQSEIKNYLEKEIIKYQDIDSKYYSIIECLNRLKSNNVKYEDLKLNLLFD